MMPTDWEAWARYLAKHLETMLAPSENPSSVQRDYDAADECLTDFQTWERKQR